MINGIGNCRPHGECGQLAQALRAERTRFLIERTHEQDLELRDFRIRRQEVAGIVAVYELTRRWIDLRLLQEGLARTPDRSSRMSMYARSKSPIGICLVESLPDRFSPSFLRPIKVASAAGLLT